MYSLATRSAAHRVAITSLSRPLARFSSTEHGNDPEVLEREKHRNLRKEQHKTSTTINNAPGWNQYLASASEAAVKADRSDHSPHDLAAETVKHIKERHHSNGEERIDAYEAVYEKDDLTGPLKDAASKVGATIKEKVVTREVHTGQ